VGAVGPLFEMRPSIGQGSFFDVSPDGQRFLVNSIPGSAADQTPAPITLVVNWTSALRK
jgi:hypothetical protein